MKKSSITGWKDVFSFTLIQTLKSKAFLVSNLILLIMAFASMPLISLITQGTKEDTSAPSPIQKVYVDNQTSLPDMDFKTVHEQKQFSQITFEPMKDNYQVTSDRIEASETASVILTMKEDAGSYSFSYVKASHGPVKDKSLQELGNVVSKEFEKFRIHTLGITKDQLAILQAPIETKVSLLDTNGVVIKNKDTTISGTEYWFIYGFWIIVFMVNMLASTQVATSIVIEKSTRVIEYLLTSVKPLALMVGKVLAMLVATLIQMVSMILVAFLSNFVSSKIAFQNGESLLSHYLPEHIFQNLNIINFIICIILILLGFIFYATLAGLAGATVSRMEDISEGITLFTFVSMIGAYIAYGAVTTLMNAGENAYVTFSFLFPLSTPFILPGAILIGKASLLTAAFAIVLQIIFIALLFLFVAKVYEFLILHNGNTIKFKQLIKIFRKLS